MKNHVINRSPLTLFNATVPPTATIIIIISFLIPTISSQTCQTACGKQPLRYPFGSGPGCGDPRFQNRIVCDQAQQKLTLTTHTGTYPITSIDYATQSIYISDPSMSTCTCTQSSRGFGLDWDAPFTLQRNTVFTLLDCSTSSPIYCAPNGGGTGNNTSAPSHCDPAGASICSFLYTCRAISMLSQPTSTCCVYVPLDLGPAYEMDLDKLKCGAYSAFYGFDGQEANPDGWSYGISLKYKFNGHDEYPRSCEGCERSGGACGYGAEYNTFLCSCPSSGFNTSSDCFLGAQWSGGASIGPRRPWCSTGSWVLLHTTLAWIWTLVL